MLPQNRRIPRRFFVLLNNGKTFKNKVFFAKIATIKTVSRFCFSISKKVVPSAVIRNRIRRAGYRILRKYLLKIKANHLVLLSFRKIPNNDDEISEEMESIFKKSKLI